MSGDNGGIGGVIQKLTRKDFQSAQDIRWCPGCGDYAVINAVQKMLAETGVKREDVVFVSGIGCSSRFPYYMNTYGFHTIHGRALAIATGLKLSRPELQVWVVTGDGDALSIGGNHFIHALRRNVDLKVLLFNNRIYGLTKGQYSPTSELGKKSKSTPEGSIDSPFNPVRLALGAGATFVARTVDVEAKHMGSILERMAKHKGTAVLEILQNCVVFNDGAFASLTEKASKEDMQIRLEHGKPVRFGKDGKKGVILDGQAVPHVVPLEGEGAAKASELVTWDERAASTNLAWALSGLELPGPTALGIFREVEMPTYEEREMELERRVTEHRGVGDLGKVLSSGETWVVERPKAMLPSQVRAQILAQHEELRRLLNEAVAVAQRVAAGELQSGDELRQRATEVRRELEKHLSHEDRVLRPVIADLDGFGPRRAAQLDEDHAVQRQMLSLLDEQAEAPAKLAELVRVLVSDLLQDMDEEERTILREELLRDDLTVLDQSGG